MLKLVDVNDSQFNTIVLKSSLPVLLQCTSPECIICKTMTERVREAGKDYDSKMVFLQFNLNENKKWQDYHVRVIPTLLYFKDGSLVAFQDNFPEVEEIREQIKLITGKKKGDVNLITEFKSAIDLEFVAAKFYQYVSSNTRNGRVRDNFKLLQKESDAHKEILQAKLKERTGELYRPVTLSKFEGLDIEPQSFSLLGALKMSVKIEKKLHSFYKSLKKEKSFPEKGLLGRLANDEKTHHKKVQQELKFLKDQELLGSMESPGYPTWLNKVFT